jgi:hypothetical protein
MHAYDADTHLMTKAYSATFLIVCNSKVRMHDYSRVTFPKLPPNSAIRQKHKPCSSLSVLGAKAGHQALGGLTFTLHSATCPEQTAPPFSASYCSPFCPLPVGVGDARRSAKRSLLGLNLLGSRAWKSVRPVAKREKTSAPSPSFAGSAAVPIRFLGTV